MSQTIQGTKSSKYIKDPVPNVTNSTDTMTHQSVQNLWDGRGASDVLMHGLTKVTGAPVAIEAGSVKRKIKVTGHGALAGQFIRMFNGNAVGEEVAIIKIIDANFFVIAKEIDAAVGDTLDIMRPITPVYNSSGEVVLTASGLATEAKQDTIIAKITKTISEKLFFNYAGVSNAGYTQVIAATADIIKSMTWFESSGQPMIIAIGAVGAEVDLMYVPPGGFNGEIPINIAAGVRVSMKQLNAEVLSAGIFVVANFYK